MLLGQGYAVRRDGRVNLVEKAVMIPPIEEIVVYPPLHRAVAYLQSAVRSDTSDIIIAPIESIRKNGGSPNI